MMLQLIINKKNAINEIRIGYIIYLGAKQNLVDI